MESIAESASAARDSRAGIAGMGLAAATDGVTNVAIYWESPMQSSSIAILVAGLAATAAQAQSTQVPTDLNHFGLVCFCNSRIATPHMVIGYDNNGEVLFHARAGSTREDLAESGAPVSESQLRMLKDWGLLREKNQRLTTAFPVLEPAAMAALRARLEPVAGRLVPALGYHAAALKRELARRRQSQAAYALLFSYVLDGLVWDELRRSGKLPKTDITVEKPYWAGTFWAIYPKQDSMPGTNTRSAGRVSLKMMWNPKVLQPINDFYAARQTGDWIASLETATAAAPLFPDPAIAPVLVREDNGDPLFEHGGAIARSISEAITATDLSRELPAADESQRLLIGTHELIWMVLAGLASKHEIAPPQVLSGRQDQQRPGAAGDRGGQPAR